MSKPKCFAAILPKGNKSVCFKKDHELSNEVRTLLYKTYIYTIVNIRRIVS